MSQVDRLKKHSINLTPDELEDIITRAIEKALSKRYRY